MAEVKGYLNYQGVVALKEGLEGEISAAQSAAEGVANAKVASVTATDNSVNVTYADADTAHVNPKIAVKIDPDTNNALSVGENGLKVTVPASTDYTVTVTKDTSSSDYAAQYTIAQAATGLSQVISIPKDMVVESGDVETNPEGKAAGTYLVLTLANATEDKVYINVSDLIEYVTSGSAAGDMVVIDIDSDHKVTATITDGTVTKAKLASDVQTSLGKADTALQPVTGKSLVDDTEITKLAGVSTGANKVEASTNGKIKIDGVDTTVYSPMDGTVVDDDYAHITVTGTTVSDGTTTLEVTAIDTSVISALFD